MESSSILVEDELNEEVTLTTEENMVMRGGYRCIACKNAIFDKNKKKSYLDHLRYLRRLSEIAWMLSKKHFFYLSNRYSKFISCTFLVNTKTPCSNS